MVRVRLLAQANVNGVTRYRGDECDLPAEVAATLVNAARAEIVRGEQPDTPERSAGIERTSAASHPGKPGRPRPERRQEQRAGNV